MKPPLTLQQRMAEVPAVDVDTAIDFLRETGDAIVSLSSMGVWIVNNELRMNAEQMIDRYRAKMVQGAGG